MRTIRFLNFAGMALIGIAGCLFALRTHLYAQQRPPVTIDADDIGGAVSSSKGPEAGVWVIAETTELPTHYIKEVVTDDQGRYLIPDLPRAKYSVWARGYGLVDSPKVQTDRGKVVNLKPTVAPENKSAQVSASGGARGLGPDRAAKGGSNPALVTVTVTEAEIAASKKLVV